MYICILYCYYPIYSLNSEDKTHKYNNMDELEKK